MFRSLWVWIPAPNTGWTFFTYICSKNCSGDCFKRPKIIDKRGGVCPFFLKNSSIVVVCFLQTTYFKAWIRVWVVMRLKARSDLLQICCDLQLLQTVAVKIEKIPIICSNLESSPTVAAICNKCERGLRRVQKSIFCRVFGIRGSSGSKHYFPKPNCWQ